MLGAITGIFDHSDKNDRLRAQKKLMNKEIELKKEDIAKKKDVYKVEKTNLLKTKLASHRANMGASGVNTSSSSSEAVMSNLKKKTEEAINNNDFFNDLNLESSLNNYDYKKRINLLDDRKADFDLGVDIAEGIISAAMMGA